MILKFKAAVVLLLLLLDFLAVVSGDKKNEESFDEDKFKSQMEEVYRLIGPINKIKVESFWPSGKSTTSGLIVRIVL